MIRPALPAIQLINPYGQIVQVPLERKAQLIRQGFKNIDHFLTVNSDENTAIIHRPFGGWGDIIATIPAIEQMAAKYELTVAIPERYHYIFRDIENVKTVDFNGFHRKHKTSTKYPQFGRAVNFWCPAGHHEAQEQYQPTKNRIENFVDACGEEDFKYYAPKIKPQFDHINRVDQDRPSVGVQLMSANISKDLPLETLEKVATELVGAGIVVYTYDESRVLDIPGVKSITKTPDRVVSSMINAHRVVLTVDSGLQWAALAQGVPVVTCYGPTNGPLTLKYFDKNKYSLIIGDNEDLCNMPCYYNEGNGYFCKSKDRRFGSKAAQGHCMKNIKPESILKEIDKWI